MKKIILIAIIAVVSTSCTNKKGAEQALLDAGYHPIKVGGYAWFGCGEDDFYHTKFEAYNSDSTRIVKGQVCQGLLKGKTIRID
jgi:hypothetical protein